MGGYAVDWAQLHSVDAQLGECVAQSRSALDSLTASARELFGTGWRGPAASAFQLGWHEWVDGVRDALSALTELADALGAAGAQYRETDGAVRGAVAGATVAAASVMPG